MTDQSVIIDGLLFVKRELASLPARGAARRLRADSLDVPAPLASTTVRWLGSGGAVLGCVALCGACASVAIELPARRGPQHPSEAGLAAGAARVEITPILGMPMGGHSKAGQIARGYWSRLYARAIYVEGAGGEAFVLVSADLWSIPSGLSDRVAELVAGSVGACSVLGREQIVLAATHTHHGPGGYSTDRFFSAFGAARGGFDERLFEHLALRIFLAIERAVEAREPARATLSRARSAGVVRNRSLEPFLANPEAAAIREANSDLPLCTPSMQYPRPEACRAVDPDIAVVSFGRDTPGAKRELIAAAVFFAVHPTVISNRSAVYSADLFGAVALRTERALAAQDPRGLTPVVAMFNGAEGDVSATWTEQNRADVIGLSARLAPLIERMALGEVGRAVSLGDDVALAFDRVRIAGRRVVTESGAPVRTALVPMPGRGTIGGAEDGRTDVPAWISHEGKRGVRLGPHGRKIGAFDFVGLFGLTVPPFYPTRLATLIFHPERRVSVGVYSIGGLRLATLPGEFTTVMGRRIREAVADAAHVGIDHVLSIGLAQSYAYYFTTPEEHELQHYEGSGMMYGKYAGSFIKTRLARIAEGARIDSSGAYRLYRAGLKASFGPHLIGTAPHVLDSHTTDIATLTPLDAEVAELPRVCWRGATVGWPRLSAHDQPDPVGITPRVHIEYLADGRWQRLIVDGAEQDDSGLRFLTLGDTDRNGGSRWCTYWIPPRGSPSTAAYRFAVRPRSYDAAARYASSAVATARCDDRKRRLYSDVFRLDGAAAEARDVAPRCP